MRSNQAKKAGAKAPLTVISRHPKPPQPLCNPRRVRGKPPQPLCNPRREGTKPPQPLWNSVRQGVGLEFRVGVDESLLAFNDEKLARLRLDRAVDELEH